MHIACIKGDNKVVKLMLHYSANPKLKSYSGMTSYDCAVEYEQEKCIEVLRPYFEDEINKKEKLKHLNSIGPLGSYNQGFRSMKNSSSMAQQDFPSSNLYVTNTSTSKHSKLSSMSRIKGIDHYNNDINMNQNLLSGGINTNNQDMDERKQMYHHNSQQTFKTYNNIKNANLNTSNISNMNMNMNNFNNNIGGGNVNMGNMNNNYHNYNNQNTTTNTTNYTNNCNVNAIPNVENSRGGGGEEEDTNLTTKYFEDKFQKYKNDIMKMNKGINMSNNNNSGMNEKVNPTGSSNYGGMGNIVSTQHKKSKSNVNDYRHDYNANNNNNFGGGGMSNNFGGSNLGSLGNAQTNQSTQHSQSSLINPINRQNHNSYNNLHDMGGLRHKHKDSKKFVHNYEEKRVVTLKPEEFLDTYEKFDSKDDSRMISPGNVMMDEYPADNSKMDILNYDNRFFGENHKTTSYKRVAETFLDCNNVLAVFVSNKNDIEYDLRDRNNQDNVSELFNRDMMYDDSEPQNNRNNNKQDDENEVLHLSYENEGNLNNTKKGIKYFSKSNCSIKDEYKQISLDTHAILNNNATSGKQVKLKFQYSFFLLLN